MPLEHAQVCLTSHLYQADYDGVNARPFAFAHDGSTWWAVDHNEIDDQWGVGQERNGVIPLMGSGAGAADRGLINHFGYLNLYASSREMFACPRNADLVAENLERLRNAEQGFDWWLHDAGDDGTAYEALRTQPSFWAVNYTINNRYVGGQMFFPGFSRPDRLHRPSEVSYVLESGHWEGGHEAITQWHGPYAGIFAHGLPGQGGRGSVIAWRLMQAAGDFPQLSGPNNASGYKIDLLRERHRGNTINALFYDGHAASRNVFDLTDINGMFDFDSYNYTTGGLTSEGEKFWGLHDAPVSEVRFFP